MTCFTTRMTFLHLVLLSIFCYNRTNIHIWEVIMLNILIVEDDTEQLKLLTDIISRTYTEWVVKTAENYNTAKTYVDESIQTHSPFSLFLLDIQLTEQPGDRGGFF